MLTRRQVLRWGLASGTLVLLPRGLLGCGGTVPLSSQPTTTSFLTDEERRTLRAVTGRIVPTDDLPGAIEAGAADYIDRLLSLLPSASDAAEVFAGGPFSNRNPFPDAASGTPSTRFPSNDFVHFIPLTRLQLLSWRVQLLGTDAVPGSDFNAAILGPVVGLRDRYRTGLGLIQSASQEMFNDAFDTLPPDQQDNVLDAVDADFVDLVTGHTIEGLFCAPEYGGNQNLVGWTLIGYDGDSQPLGYSIFDETTMSYNERADKPNSTANPDEDFSGFDATTQQFLKVLVRVVGGPHFP